MRSLLYLLFLAAATAAVVRAAHDISAEDGKESAPSKSDSGSAGRNIVLDVSKMPDHGVLVKGPT